MKNGRTTYTTTYKSKSIISPKTVYELGYITPHSTKKKYQRILYTIQRRHFVNHHMDLFPVWDTNDPKPKP